MSAGAPPTALRPQEQCLCARMVLWAGALKVLRSHRNERLSGHCIASSAACPIIQVDKLLKEKTNCPGKGRYSCATLPCPRGCNSLDVSFSIQETSFSRNCIVQSTSACHSSALCCITCNANSL